MPANSFFEPEESSIQELEFQELITLLDAEATNEDLFSKSILSMMWAFKGLTEEQKQEIAGKYGSTSRFQLIAPQDYWEKVLQPQQVEA